MRRIYLVSCLSLISIVTIAQKFETSISISQAVTTWNPEIPIDKIALGLSGSIQGFYYLTENIAVGTELNYAYQDLNLSEDFKGVSIPESNSYYESDIIIQSLNVPLIFRYRTQKNWLAQLGMGLTYILDTKTEVNYIYSDQSNETNTKTEINDKTNDFGKDFNSYLNIGFGKGFKIWSVDANVQIFSEIALQNYEFTHAGVHDEAAYDYKIQPFMLGLRIGVKL